MKGHASGRSFKRPSDFAREPCSLRSTALAIVSIVL
jgi:hypothetical protein